MPRANAHVAVDAVLVDSSNGSLGGPGTVTHIELSLLPGPSRHSCQHHPKGDSTFSEIAQPGVQPVVHVGDHVRRVAVRVD